MNPSEIAVVVALMAGSLRAVKVWRAAAKVAVINVAVLSTLAQGRSRDLPALLRGAGPGAYRSVAQAVAESALRLSTEGNKGELSVREAQQQLERDAARAVIAAARRAGVDTALDSLLLIALVFASVNAAVNDQATGPLALGLVATTLLWISNVWGSRSHVTRMYAGAMALADGLAQSLDNLESTGPPKPAFDPAAIRDVE
jgi:hypothetical protein